MNNNGKYIGIDIKKLHISHNEGFILRK